MNRKYLPAEHTIHAFHVLRVILKRALQTPNTGEQSVGQGCRLKK
jgi:hypothetical protein